MTLEIERDAEGPGVTLGDPDRGIKKHFPSLGDSYDDPDFGVDSDIGRKDGTAWMLLPLAVVVVIGAIMWAISTLPD